MIRSLKDILVVSDMDNTLLTPVDGVPFVNQVTMRLFLLTVPINAAMTPPMMMPKSTAILATKPLA